MSLLPINSSEEFVFKLCRQSFLSLWCYDNPKGKDGDELCDVLVVCDPHIVIISVKEKEFNLENDAEVESKRWQRKAIDKSVDQIRGAERWLKNATHVIRRDGTLGMPLPPLADRKIHRVAVALGGKGEVPVGSRETDFGHVHVMEEEGFDNIITELNTITDFIDYLVAKEANGATGCKSLVLGAESNLLALYLLNGRQFPPDASLLIVDDTVWGGLQEMEEYRLMKKADEVSYMWDRLIEYLSGSGYDSLGNSDPHKQGLEFALRLMARENRFHRRMLGRTVTEFYDQELIQDTRFRKARSPTGVNYAFIEFKVPLDAKRFAKFVEIYCRLTRHEFGQGDGVVAIIFTGDFSRQNSTCQLAYYDTTNWTKADDESSAELKQMREKTTVRTTSEITEKEYFGKKPKGN